MYRLESGASLKVLQVMVDGVPGFELVFRDQSTEEKVLWRARRDNVGQPDLSLLAVETAWETSDSISAVLVPSIFHLVIVRAWKDPSRGQALAIIVWGVPDAENEKGQRRFRFVNPWQLEVTRPSGVEGRSDEVARTLLVDENGRATLDGETEHSELRIGGRLFKPGKIRQAPDGNLVEGTPEPGEPNPLSTFPGGSEAAKVPDTASQLEVTLHGIPESQHFRWIAAALILIVATTGAIFLVRKRSGRGRK